MARRNAVRIKIDGIKEIQGRLEKVGLTLRSPAVTREIQRGAEVMAARARARAPQDTGKLRQGIYTASTECNGFVALTRRGQRLNSPLRRWSWCRVCFMGSSWSEGASGARASGASGRSAFSGWA